MRAAVYVRVSTEDQARRGYSLAEQREACRARAESLGAAEVLEFADEAYKGEWAVRFNGREAVVPVPAIIDPETWDAAQDKLARSRRLWAGGNNKRDYLLKGVLTCGDCGCPMRGKSGGGYHWYTCGQDRGVSRRTGCRPKKLVPAEALEKTVWEKVKAVLSDPDMLAREAAARAPEEEGLRAELERAEKRLAETEKGREAVLEALASGLFELDARTRAKLAESKRRKERVERRTRELEAGLRSASTAAARFDGLRALAKDVLGRLDELSFEEKRALVRALVAQVTASGTQVRYGPRLAGVTVTVALNLAAGESRSPRALDEFPL